MTAFELNRSPLGDQVYELLRAAILKHEFTPGQRLSPQELSERFQVSATPIRDALRRLESDGLIQVSPRRGTFVTKFTAQDVREMFESRRIIEQAAVEALPRVPDAVIQRISSLSEEMSGLLNGELVRQYLHYLELDEAFHNSIVDMLGNRRLTGFYRSLRAHTYVALTLFSSEKRMPETHLEHCEIVAACQQRDVALARRAISLHLENAAADILHKMSLVPEGSGEGARSKTQNIRRNVE